MDHGLLGTQVRTESLQLSESKLGLLFVLRDLLYWFLGLSHGFNLGLSGFVSQVGLLLDHFVDQVGDLAEIRVIHAQEARLSC